MPQPPADFGTQFIDAVTDFRFDPGWDTAVALGIVLAFWPIFYIGWKTSK